MGPGAGEHGGRIVAEGTPEDVAAHPDSLTGAYLSGPAPSPCPKSATPRPRAPAHPRRARQQPEERLASTAGRPVHLHHRRLRLGQVTLINDTLYAARGAPPLRQQRRAGAVAGIDGLDHFDKVINVDQSPIGRTPRSNPATYTGLLTPIRELFAGVPESRKPAATGRAASPSTSRAGAARPARATA
jgi:excinuclease ABC subunit A